ncbi:hypothetical protein LR48_Vigan11g115500 [Vigna angularis]|uniref:Uncharacterized protein n=1 Tax=Phaseolus angularis TaxID=3914 RepID=A0A0L9VSR7_PHAAN|nr:hypothetical protein LR48_Vigan11g115500 [Vigna angularis]
MVQLNLEWYVRKEDRHRPEIRAAFHMDDGGMSEGSLAEGSKVEKDDDESSDEGTWEVGAEERLRKNNEDLRALNAKIGVLTRELFEICQTPIFTEEDACGTDEEVAGGVDEAPEVGGDEEAEVGRDCVFKQQGDDNAVDDPLGAYTEIIGNVHRIVMFGRFITITVICVAISLDFETLPQLTLHDCGVKILKATEIWDGDDKYNGKNMPQYTTMIASEDIGRQILTYGERKPLEQFLKEVDAITLNDISKFSQKIITSPLTMASYGDVMNRLAASSMQNERFCSASGHGTHTSSSATGVVVENASFMGLAKGWQEVVLHQLG